MNTLATVGVASLMGFAATSSSLLGAALGLYLPINKRLLACILAFAAGSLIAALAIDLAYSGAQQLHSNGFSALLAWAYVGGGFTLGALVYYVAAIILDQKGACVRLPTRFQDYAIKRKQRASRERIALLAKCNLLLHLSPEAIGDILPFIGERVLQAGELLFQAGDPGNALYIVEEGAVEVFGGEPGASAGPVIARLQAGDVIGEMALLSGKPRTAAVRAAVETRLLEISKLDFDRLTKGDRQMANAAQRLSHERALSNLASQAPNPVRWAEVAASNLHHVTRGEADAIFAQAAHGAGLAIVLGEILNTIPGCLVIGAKFVGFGNMSLTLMIGMFMSSIPEAAVSGTMLTRAGFSPKAIFGLWSLVVVVGLMAAGAGKLFLSDPDSALAVFAQGIAGGALLALIAHTMIPEAIHEGRSLIVLPTVAGFLFALYLSLMESLG